MDYKEQAAAEALKLISVGQIIGLGNGACVSHLARMVAGNEELAESLTLTSSAASTTELLNQLGLNVSPPSFLSALDIYFDGCDQFDAGLNALKSGGGIHTTEKILAAMATEFVLIGDAAKMVTQFSVQVPLVVEILKPALASVMEHLKSLFPTSAIKLRKSEDSVVFSDYGNYLLDIHFSEFTELKTLDTTIKMLPGVVDHSLFYQLANKAIVAGPAGIRTVFPAI